MTAEVPVIDLGDDSEDVAAAVDEALQTIGFMTVVGHQVKDEVVTAAWQAAIEFFALPEEEKNAYVDPDGPYGYTPLSAETLARSRGHKTPADLKESFNLGPFDQRRKDLEALGFGSVEIVWPRRPEEFRQAWTDYYKAMVSLADRLLVVMAKALELSVGHFASAFTRHTSALRSLHYPPLETRPEPGQLRAGEHSDYGSLTILRPGEGRGGLEVKAGDGTWVSVPAVEGAFVVNIGDVMARWTNDRWVSTLHRVVVPPEEVALTEHRYSMAFFQNPAADALIEVVPTCVEPGEAPRYEPIEFADWLREKVEAVNSD